MPGLAKEARDLRACVVALEEASKTKASKVCAKRRTAETEVVAEQTRTERAEPTAKIAQLKDVLHELNGKLDFSERRNSFADSRYSILSDECESLKRQVASGEV